MKKYRDLANEIKKINPKSKVLFTKINSKKAIEINDIYEVQNFPCIYLYYMQDQKAAFIPKDEMDIERAIKIWIKMFEEIERLKIEKVSKIDDLREQLNIFKWVIIYCDWKEKLKENNDNIFLEKYEGIDIDLKNKSNMISVLIVEFEDSKDIADLLEIKEIKELPSLFLFKKGKKIETFKSKKELENEIIIIEKWYDKINEDLRIPKWNARSNEEKDQRIQLKIILLEFWKCLEKIWKKPQNIIDIDNKKYEGRLQDNIRSNKEFNYKHHLRNCN